MRPSPPGGGPTGGPAAHPGAPGPDPDAPVRTLTVVCPDWPLVAAGLGDSTDAPGRPAAVLFANRVVATNHAARAADVTVGLRRRDAQGRCPHLEIVPHDPARDARRFEAVAAALTTLTPRVEITEPGVCSFPTRGPSRYHGGDADLARLAAGRATAAAGVAALVGVADGPVVARLASARAGPGLPRVVPPGKAAEFMASIPVAHLVPLAPDPDVLDTLVRLGLTTMGAVAALSEGPVVGRFGPGGVWAHRLARGLDPEPLHLQPVPPDVEAAFDLDPPAERADAVAFAARTLADDLVGRLGARGLACRQVVATLHTDHGEVHERCWRLDGPAGPGGGRVRPVAAVIAERVRWQVDGWLSGPVGSRPTSGVSRVVLSPGLVEAARGRQMGFWGGEAGAGERVLRAVARLEALVGPEAVAVPEEKGGRHPADAVALVPAAAVDLTERRTVIPGGAPQGSGGPRRDPGPWPGRLPTPSPTSVPVDPVEVDLLDAEGRTVEVDGRGEMHRRPASVHRGGARVEVTGWSGPWPVDERWWDHRAHHRRARLQVALADGSAHLLGRSAGRWWLDATYG